MSATKSSLIDWETGKPVKYNRCDAFGFGLTGAIPYAYAGKRYDPKTGLVYFGKRYYDPELARWLTAGLGVTTSTGAALMGLGLATTTYHAQDMQWPAISWKNTNVYVPDRPLPNNPVGIHVPDADAPHTQLGTKEGRHGKYPQAREFDEKGNPVRDIDFTDHERPRKHPNPHQHEHKPNPTGGTRIRDPIAKPVTGWSYE